MSLYEYMWIPLSLIPDDIFSRYDLRKLSKDGWVYMKIRKGMPGLNQAGGIANERLTKLIQNYGYAPFPRTPVLWRDNTLPIVFILVVDNFGVKYTGKHNVDHLINEIRVLYTITFIYTESLYCGLTLARDYG